MFEGRLISRRLRIRLGRGFVAAAGGVVVLGAGAWSAPASLTAVVQNQPMHLLVHAATGRSATTTAATENCWQSTNWSGYVLSTNGGLGCVPASGKTYSSVAGTWTVPAVTGSTGGGGLLGGLLGTSSNNTYSAIWTGIDGAPTGNTNLIQAGTEEDFANGAPSYYAWWEILPAPETQIAMTVKPGDSVTVNIAHASGSNWTITITDNGSAQHPGSQTFSTTQTYTGSGSSAEWIVEAPNINGQQSTLANYSSTVFDHGSVNGAAVALQPGTGGQMVTQSGGILGIGSSTTVISSPSDPDTGAPQGDGFACAYGSNQPAPPGS